MARSQLLYPRSDVDRLPAVGYDGRMDLEYLEEVRHAMDVLADRLWLALAALSAIDDYTGRWSGVHEVLTSEEVERLEEAVKLWRQGTIK